MLTEDKVNQVGAGYLGGNIFSKDINELDVQTFEYQFLPNKLQEEEYKRSESLRLKEQLREQR